MTTKQAIVSVVSVRMSVAVCVSVLVSVCLSVQTLKNYWKESDGSW